MGLTAKTMTKVLRDQIGVSYRAESKYASIVSADDEGDVPGDLYVDDAGQSVIIEGHTEDRGYVAISIDKGDVPGVIHALKKSVE